MFKIFIEFARFLSLPHVIYDGISRVMHEVHVSEGLAEMENVGYCYVLLDVNDASLICSLVTGSRQR